MIYTFLDENRNKVQLAFKRHAFSTLPGHVLVLCKYKNCWLLTDHPERGLEFPGGKIEKGETIEEAGVREVYEETGGTASINAYLGEYEVYDRQKGSFVKAILVADIVDLKKKDHYSETKGPVLLEGDLLPKLQGDEFSFIMKDRVVKKSLQRMEELLL